MLRDRGLTPNSTCLAGWRLSAVRAAWKTINTRRREHQRESAIDPDALAHEASSPDLGHLTALLQKVSPASRVVLTLHYLEGMTLEATAAALGVVPGTVESRLAYGLRQLREAGLPNVAD